MAEPDNFEEDLFADLYVFSQLQTSFPPSAFPQLVRREKCHFIVRLSTALFSSIISTFRHRANVQFRYTEDDSAPKPAAASAVKSEPAAAPEMKTEEAEQNGNGDEQMYGGEQDDDDEIDFNLGNGAGGEQTYEAPPSHHEAHGPGIKEDG